MLPPDLHELVFAKIGGWNAILLGTAIGLGLTIIPFWVCEAFLR